MCGRYGINMTMHEAARRLGVDAGKILAGHKGACYNVTPGQERCAAIANPENRADIELANTHWGFLPSWQNQPSKSSINMRVESSRKRYWHKAFCKRRCVVPANWWYEWKPEEGVKQPYGICAADTDGVFFAGVWSVAKGVPNDHPLHGQRTFAILTQPALPAIASIHHRMPIALDDDTARQWLESGESLDALHAILGGSALMDFDAWRVSTRVDKPANNDVGLLDRID